MLTGLDEASSYDGCTFHVMAQCCHRKVGQTGEQGWCRWNIASHDYAVKRRKLQEFLEKGKTVSVAVTYDHRPKTWQEQYPKAVEVWFLVEKNVTMSSGDMRVLRKLLNLIHLNIMLVLYTQPVHALNTNSGAMLRLHGSQGAADTLTSHVACMAALSHITAVGVL
jgi:hypothetical protein